jgi:3D (Asp-Asp-Asp) domain-containing protein
VQRVSNQKKIITGLLLLSMVISIFVFVMLRNNATEAEMQVSTQANTEANTEENIQENTHGNIQDNPQENAEVKSEATTETRVLASMDTKTQENIETMPEIKPEVNSNEGSKGKNEQKSAETKGQVVKLIADGKTTELITEKTLTGEILEEAGISLNSQDRVTPGLSEEVKDKIKIVRVTKKTIEEKKALPYATEQTESDEFFKGETRVLQKGVQGTENHVYEVTREDGKEIERVLLKQEVVKEPIKEVVAHGTRGIVSRGGSMLNIEKILKMSSTAYTHTGRRTCTDVWPSVGIVAVDPKVIPLGTRLYIDGYGYATPLDTGGSIKGNKIDLFFETREEALKWGRREVQVFVLQTE